MIMKGLMYYSPRMYEMMMHVSHRGDLPKRFGAIKGLIGPGRVLELGCGTAFIQDFLDRPYLGIEKNPRFATYALRKNRNVVVDDIFNYGNYLRKGHNTVLLMDVLHHIPNPAVLLDRLMDSNISQVIICEPYNLPESVIHSSKALNRLFDSDGINDATDWHDRESLIDFYEGYGGVDLTEIRNSIITRIPVR